jgi:hypothetical protein
MGGGVDRFCKMMKSISLKNYWLPAGYTRKQAVDPAIIAGLMNTDFRHTIYRL